MQDTAEDPPPPPPPGWSALVGTFAIMFLLGLSNCVFALTSALGTANTQTTGGCTLVKAFFEAAHESVSGTVGDR